MNPEFRHLEGNAPRTTEGRHVRDHWWAIWYVVIGILIGWAAR